jgi:hypothetical protein
MPGLPLAWPSPNQPTLAGICPAQRVPGQHPLERGTRRRVGYRLPWLVRIIILSLDTRS